MSGDQFLTFCGTPDWPSLGSQHGPFWFLSGSSLVGYHPVSHVALHGGLIPVDNIIITLELDATRKDPSPWLVM